MCYSVQYCATVCLVPAILHHPEGRSQWFNSSILAIQHYIGMEGFPDVVLATGKQPIAFTASFRSLATYEKLQTLHYPCKLCIAVIVAL